MYVILGGAYNGKRVYVEQLIAQMPEKELIICEGILPEAVDAAPSKRFVIREFEKIILPLLDQPEEQVAQQIVEQIQQLANVSEVFCICTDQSRGVVPIDKQARQMRDTCGRVYQKLCTEADTVIRVWYGIPQRLKGVQDGEK